MLDKYITDIEILMKSLAEYEKKGLDTSSLRLFLKNLKTFNKIHNTELHNSTTFSEKLEVIKSFLEDKKVFPKISDIIDFANVKLNLNFKDQKESRSITIRRILGRISETPELKEKVKIAVLELSKNTSQNSNIRSKKDKDVIDSFSKWAEILRKI